MPDRDPARLFFDLATTNRATFHAILDDVHLTVEDFVAVHHRSIREHCIRQGYSPSDERALRAASNLWTHLQSLQSWTDQLLASAESRAPLRRLATIDDVGRTAVFLASEAGSGLSGSTTYVDAGVNVRA